MIAIVEAFFMVWFSGGGDFKVFYMFLQNASFIPASFTLLKRIHLYET
jgi:hypothetical protein